ncbi:exocyst complex component Sec10-like protein [Lipomyces oligophaga]|uniref:exocyst complex component Sec10-like protein n=1 Tax=Lipomyces oligophaga TaxID=45792 RepID=UPI0034CD55F4
MPSKAPVAAVVAAPGGLDRHGNPLGSSPSTSTLNAPGNSLELPHPKGPRRLSSSNLLPILSQEYDGYARVPLLPSPVYAVILEYLPLAQYVTCASICRSFRQIVYDDAGWIARLRRMKVWDDSVAEKYYIDEKKRSEAKKIIIADLSKQQLSPLNVLDSVHSFPGYARLEFARVYSILWPLYRDLTNPIRAIHLDPQVFRIYRSPEVQALILKTMTQFAAGILDDDAEDRLLRLLSIAGIFENAALSELEQGLDESDFDGRARRYAEVLIGLNGGGTAVQTYLQRSKILVSTSTPSTSACFFLDKGGNVKVDLAPVDDFLRHLLNAIKDENHAIWQVFGDYHDIAEKTVLMLIEKVVDDILGDYCSALVERSRNTGNRNSHLIVVSGLYEALLDWTYHVLANDDDDGENAEGQKSMKIFHEKIRKFVDGIYEQHVDLYYQEELDRFKEKCDEQLNRFETDAERQEQTKESVLRSKYKESVDPNAGPGAEKFDFLTSFKKVLLMPVVAIGNTPVISIGSSFTASSHASSMARPGLTELTPDAAPELDVVSDRQSVAAGSGAGSSSGNSSKYPIPANELAANAAILNSRLESIKTLFSLEVALSLIQAARESIERTALFAGISGPTGREAVELCEAIFVALLDSLGFRHIHNGFDKALQHLTEYHPPAVRENSLNLEDAIDEDDEDDEDDEMSSLSPEARQQLRRRHIQEKERRTENVEPLVTFLELVNVGDLIQQMVEVFYEKELVSRKFVDRTNFLSHAVNEKRRFEQMLDEKVAQGLNRGIDVLIEQVDFILRTEQKQDEFNIDHFTVVANATTLGYTTTTVSGDQSFIDSRMGPTNAALKVVKTVGTHTKLLVGSTDKNTLDVFLGEVGLRLYGSLGKHIKRQTISVDGGAVLLISDLNYYYQFVETQLRQRTLIPYFTALREIAQLYLIDTRSAKEIGIVMSDVVQKFAGFVTAEDVLEYVERRADWLLIKRRVEKAVYGLGLTDCVVM